MGFLKGDLVFYDRIGVCRVEAVGRPDLKGLPTDLDYYTLQPVYQADPILIPVTTSAYLRRLLTREEAEALLARLEDLEPVETGGLDARRIAALYQLPAPVDSGEMLARLARTGYRRDQLRIAAGRRPNAADQRFRKFAEKLFHGELAVVLDVPLEEVEAQIRARVRAAG